MELVLGVLGFLGTVAGLAFKVWRQGKDVKAVADERDQWKKLAARAAAENTKLRAILADKEVKLASAQAALAARMSAGELASALTELFGGPDAPAGRGAEQPAAKPKT